MKFFSDRKVTVTFDLLTVIKVTLVVMAVLLAFEFLADLQQVLILIVIAAFLAISLNPVVSKINNHLPSRNRTLATGVSFTLVVSIITAFLILTLPPIVKQVSQFASDLPQTVEDFKTQDNLLSNLVNRYNLDTEISEAAKGIATRVAGADGGLSNTLNKVTTTVLSVVAVLIMTFMMVVEGPKIVKQTLALSDPAKLAKRRRLLKQMYEVVVGYVNGQLVIAVIAAAVSLVAMVILRVPNALAMAGLVGLFGMIPLIGATLAAVIVVLSTMLVNVKLAIIMAVFFVIYQQIENATIQPYIQGRRSSLSTLTVFISALIGASIAGIFGAFLAIPLAGCLKILLDDYLKTRAARATKADLAD